MNISSPNVIKMLFAAVVLILWAPVGNAFDKINQTFFGTAIKGYDTVA
jgi:hypothetical protein